MRRLISLLAAGSLLAALPMATFAAVPDYQRVIQSRLADAALVANDDCLLTEIFVSASDAVYGGRPGPVNKQGLAGVLIRRTDLCVATGAAPTAAGIFAAGGGGGTVVFDGLGQTLDPLSSDPQLTAAWLQATIPVTNEVTGESVDVELDLRWRLVGELVRDTGHSHLPPREYDGTVNSHWNTLMGDAVVGGTVRIGTELLAFTEAEGAHLQQVKYGCQVIVHPRGDADLDC